MEEGARPIRVATSSDALRRLKRAGEWLKAHEPSTEVLIVGATADAANELARHAVDEIGSAFGWHRVGLPQLAAAVAAEELSNLGLVPISRLGAEAITTRVVHEARLACDLGRYQSIGDAPGLARAFTNVCSELRLAQLSASSLRELAPDVGRILKAYEEELETRGLTDWAGVVELATSLVERRGPSASELTGLPTLLIDVPVITRAEQRFVGALAKSAKDLLIVAPSSDQISLGRISAELRPTLEKLDELEADPSLSNSITRLKRHLFNDAEHVGEPTRDDHVQVFSAPGEGRECVELARRVLATAREGVPFDRIGVLLRAPETYRSYLDEAFSRAGVPVHFARGAVRPDPVGRAFYALLRCAAENLSASRFAEYLSLGQLPSASDKGTPPQSRPSADRWVPPDQELMPSSISELSELPADSDVSKTQQLPADELGEEPVLAGQLRAPRRWERLLVEAAVIGGRDRWRRRLEGRLNEERARLDEARDEDDGRAEAIGRTLDDLSAFSDFALPLIDDLADLPETANWGEWLDHLGALATRSLKEPDRVLSVLSELAPMTTVGPVTLSEVLQTVEQLLLEVAVPPSPQRYGRVFVGPIDAARGLSFDVVFAPGLAEKMFPKKIVEDPILLDHLRESLSPDLATNQTRLEQERLALMLAAGAAERQICFSYPRLDLEQARPRVPSFYGLEALRAAEGKLPDFTDFAERAETSTNARLGWPAPEDPGDAIDDAEHDLAIIGRLVDRSEEGAGAARYLLTANPNLGRALKMRARRWGLKWTSADGMLTDSADAKAVLARHGIGVRSYSPTALQNYAHCPYRFFLHAIQRLSPREIPEELDELDPLERGSLIHDIQFELFTRLGNQKDLPVRPSNLGNVWGVLDTVIEEIEADYRDRLAPAIERVWNDGISAIRTDLRDWLRRASEDESGFVPWHFELSFGLEHTSERRQADPASVPGAVDLDCGIQLRGSIDLVERDTASVARVTDHKTGKPPPKKVQLTGGGKTLQPLFYALAAEKIFAGKVAVQEGRLYFCTTRGDFAEQSVHLDEHARHEANEIADAIGTAIGEAFLPAMPDKKACDYCDFRVVCGPYEERRTARKPTGRLEPLIDIRRTA